MTMMMLMMRVMILALMTMINDDGDIYNDLFCLVIVSNHEQ
jgi:hypothetical protein